MPRFTKEPQEEEEIAPFLEALAISWGLENPDPYQVFLTATAEGWP